MSDELGVCNNLCMSTQVIGPSRIPQQTRGDRMRMALRHAGVGVQEMASYLGVARNTVSTWINDRITPSKQTLRLWAMRCAVPLVWLETGKAPDEPGPEGLSYTTRDSNPEPAGLEFFGGARRNYTPILRFPRHGQAVAA